MVKFDDVLYYTTLSFVVGVITLFLLITILLILGVAKIG